MLLKAHRGLLSEKNSQHTCRKYSKDCNNGDHQFNWGNILNDSVFMLTKGKPNVLKRWLVISKFVFHSHMCFRQKSTPHCDSLLDSKIIQLIAQNPTLWFPELTSLSRPIQLLIPSCPFLSGWIHISVEFLVLISFLRFSDICNIGCGLFLVFCPLLTTLRGLVILFLQVTVNDKDQEVFHILTWFPSRDYHIYVISQF